MGDQVWLTLGQVERLRPHLPKVRGKASPTTARS
jgi:hypothetical protein